MPQQPSTGRYNLRTRTKQNNAADKVKDDSVQPIKASKRRIETKNEVVKNASKKIVKPLKVEKRRVAQKVPNARIVKFYGRFN